MSDSAAKDSEKLTLNSMPPPTETQSDDELPIEAVLAILYSMVKRLEKASLAEIRTGQTANTAITYIRLSGVEIDPVKGFVLAQERK